MNLVVFVVALILTAIFFFTPTPPHPETPSAITTTNLQVNNFGKQVTVERITDIRWCPFLSKGDNRMITNAEELRVDGDSKEILANAAKVTIIGSNVVYCGRVTEELNIYGYNVAVYVLHENK